MKTSYWIFYPGDFEHYHGLVQNFGRIERGKVWPAFWKSEGFRHRVAFRKSLDLEEGTSFTVYAKGKGYVLCSEGKVKTDSELNEKKYRIGELINLPAGHVDITVHLACIEALPAVFVDSPVITSDHSWTAGDYCTPPVKAGYSPYFTRKEQDPYHFDLTEEKHQPVHAEEINNGVLYEFDNEYTAQISVIRRNSGPAENGMEVSGQTESGMVESGPAEGGMVESGPAEGGLIVYPGESREEALDLLNCYLPSPVDPKTGLTDRAAVHFLFVPDCRIGDYEVTALHQYLDIPVKFAFHSNQEDLNRIWKVAENTFRLCSGVFFVDGIKRDTWIWAGDAYQSFFVNECLFQDPDINRRTLLALAGNSPVTTHINTITDYTMLWILGVYRHVNFYHDEEFLEYVYPKMVEYMDFLAAQVNEEGFFIGRPGDWIYIDWADMDKTGALCAEQMLYIRCLQVMQELQEKMEGREAEELQNEGRKAGELQNEGRKAEEPQNRDRKAEEQNQGREAGEPLTGAMESYGQKARNLLEKLDRFFWDSRAGAYIDSYESGKHNVTRHANIFAILFDIATEEQKKSILQNVLFNDAVPAITTPYFKFFEMDALCSMGYTEKVLEEVRAYWGGMLAKGAVTFWEEYDPDQPEEEQYDMYGDHFGKSLCHAWAASPIYLFTAYLMKDEKLREKYEAVIEEC